MYAIPELWSRREQSGQYNFKTQYISFIQRSFWGWIMINISFLILVFNIIGCTYLSDDIWAACKFNFNSIIICYVMTVYYNFHFLHTESILFMPLNDFKLWKNQFALKYPNLLQSHVLSHTKNKNGEVRLG